MTKPSDRTSKSAKAECVCSFYQLEDGQTTGCLTTNVRRFAPGHDAKLKGLLVRAAKADLLVKAGGDDARPALDVAADFGYEQYVEKALASNTPTRPRRTPATPSPRPPQAQSPEARAPKSRALIQAEAVPLPAELTLHTKVRLDGPLRGTFKLGAVPTRTVGVVVDRLEAEGSVLVRWDNGVTRAAFPHEIHLEP